MKRHASLAFSLIELLAAVAVTLLVLVFLLQMLGFSSSQWQNTSENAKAFQAARAAFESITRSLSQATLATEYDYYNTARQSRQQLAAQGDTTGLQNFVPEVYGRSSGLHFVSGRNLVANQHTHAIFFEAPFDFTGTTGTEPASGQLNAIGYFVGFGSDAANRPPNVTSSKPAPKDRFRLLQYFQPTSALDVYRDAAGMNWFKSETDLANPANTHVLAENIVVLALLPKLPDEMQQPADAIAPGYKYDSRTPWTAGKQPVQMHQLPPVVRVVMVAVDENSARRHPGLGTNFQNLFQNPNELSLDLERVESELRDKRVNYRIFQTDVLLRAAKWSE